MMKPLPLNSPKASKISRDLINHCQYTHTSNKSNPGNTPTPSQAEYYLGDLFLHGHVVCYVENISDFTSSPFRFIDAIFTFSKFPGWLKSLQFSVSHIPHSTNFQILGIRTVIEIMMNFWGWSPIFINEDIVTILWVTPNYLLPLVAESPEGRF